MLSLIRRAQPLLFAVIICLVAYNGWFFYSRWSGAREAEQMRLAKEREDAQRIIDSLGGGKLKILSFYANPGIIQRGGRSNICYGVYGARSVRMEPPVESLRPAVSHCLQVSPRQTTLYKLIADDGTGQTATESFTLRVDP